MSSVITEITEHSCRFCLAQDENTQSVFERFDSKALDEHLQGILGMQLEPCDKYKCICENCASKVELIFSMLADFRNANRLFCDLIEQERTLRQWNTKNNVTINIEVLDQTELASIIQNPSVSSDKQSTADREAKLSPKLIDVSIKKEKVDLVAAETSEEETYVDELQYEPEDDPGTAIPDIQDEPIDEVQHCFVCNAFSGAHGALSEHLLTTHSDMLPYRSDQCIVILEDVFDLNDHFRTYQTPFGCLYCEEMYASKIELDEHRSLCIGYGCAGCDKSFLFVSQLKEHNLCISSKVQREHIVKRLIGCYGGHKPTCLLRCAMCTEEFTQNADLAQHFEREHSAAGITVHCCDLCPQKFTSITTARQHRIVHEKASPPKSSKANECVVCRKSFKFNRELLQHLEMCHAEVTVKLHQCAKCERKFTTETKLRKHDYNMHQGRQPKFFCSFCGRVFNKRIGLQDHENHHRGVKEYRCYECNREFAYKSSFDRHIQVVHNDSKQFTCMYCQKSFKRKPTLKVHLRLHTGEKPYQCEFCSRRFVDPSSFHRHKQKEHSGAT